ncbi:hypothetical protein GCM10023310_32990 [Paenibacillus vulneris]|uniref:GyrI-like domain-containing protein n=1 Tax=Paenibacillus vulneris TaxID=1133364 RepID=A0ABW3UU00_9BACL
MQTYQDEVLDREEIKLVGFSIMESLHNVLETKIVRTLRESLAAQRNEIENREGDGIYLLQDYCHEGQWTPHVPYRHVVAYEVSSYGEIPKGMTTHTLLPGRYTKVVHQGPESQISATYEYINNTHGERPIDIEYWTDIHALENDNSQIDIYFPSKG